MSQISSRATKNTRNKSQKWATEIDLVLNNGLIATVMNEQRLDEAGNGKYQRAAQGRQTNPRGKKQHLKKQERSKKTKLSKSYIGNSVVKSHFD